MANQAVYGLVGSRDKAEAIIQSLVDMGVNPNDISFLSSQREEFYEFTTTNPNVEGKRNWRTEERLPNQPSANLTEERHLHPNAKNQGKSWGKGGLGTEKHTKAPEGATAGVTTGGIIGGTLGLLAGIGALAIPGLGPFIAAGPLMGALSGLGAGGAIGGIIGALVGSGIPEYEAKRYENRLKEGGILLAIRAESDNYAKRVKKILLENGAEDVSVSSEALTSKKYHK